MPAPDPSSPEEYEKSFMQGCLVRVVAAGPCTPPKSKILEAVQASEEARVAEHLAIVFKKECGHRLILAMTLEDAQQLAAEFIPQAAKAARELGGRVSEVEYDRAGRAIRNAARRAHNPEAN